METAQLETAPTKWENGGLKRRSWKQRLPNMRSEIVCGGDHNLTDRVTKTSFRHFLCQSVGYGYPSRAVSALSRFI